MRMRSCSIHVLAAFAGAALIALSPAAAQTPAANPAQAPATSPAPPAPPAPGAEAPVVRDLSQKKAIDLLAAIESLLTRAATERSELKDLPSRDNYVIPPLWKETREDREAQIRKLLDSVLEIVTDAPVVQMQASLQDRRHAIAQLKDQITALRERRLRAPESGLMPGILSETQSSIDGKIRDIEARIKSNEEEIAKGRLEIKEALKNSGVDISDAQLDLLLDSVLGSDLIKLVTAFQAARSVDDQLGTLLTISNEDVKAARRYFAMHAALFAMMVHAQEIVIEKIDKVYIAKLRGILGDIRVARDKSKKLLGEQNRPDQQRALDANVKAQNFSEKVASFYRDYLLTQRRQLAEARDRTLRDLAIADNTFATVEASFQLHELMEDARTSFEALQRLEAPGFEQVFRNETLRKEFESLTQKLGPTS
ncbi:MAG TPA: hypothetical protein VH858_05070 [Hyphomicrobiales bacterium]|jgi:hypothetical protein